MAFPDGWLYRKSITLSRASGAVTNYQMKLLVGESSGAAGEDVECGGLCKTDFSDLRFTNTAGALLDYWIESVSGATPNQLATIWIEFDSVGTGATTFYMYYGNAGASAVSSGANTFIAFDDFERGANGDAVGGAWTAFAGSPKIATAQKYSGTRSMSLPGDGTNYPDARISLPHSDNIAIQYQVYVSAGSSHWMGHGDGTNQLLTSVDSPFQVYNGAAWVDTTLDLVDATWTLMEHYNFRWASALCDVAIGGVAATDRDISDARTQFVDLVRLAGNITNGQFTYIDNFIVRNYRATGPAWGAWGGQEDLGGGSLMNNQFFVMLLAGGGR